MGVFDRMKGALKSSANAAIDKAQDPGKQIAYALNELDEGLKEVTQELISYKANEKQMASRSAALEEEIGLWEARAKEAVLAGDDALAKEALAARARAAGERQSVEADRLEQGRLAAELLRGRRELVRKIESLKLRQSTLTMNTALARGRESKLSTESKSFEELARIEDQIEDKAALAEVDEVLGVDRAAGPDLRPDAEAELEALKKKMKERG